MFLLRKLVTVKSIVWPPSTVHTRRKIPGALRQFHGELNLKGRTIPVLSEEGGVGRGHPEITPFINQFFNGSGGDENSTRNAIFMTDSSTGFFFTILNYPSFLS